MNVLWVVLIVLLVLAFAGLPHWGYMAPRGYGYWPSGTLGLILVILLILLLAGRL